MAERIIIIKNRIIIIIMQELIAGFGHKNVELDRQ